MPTFRRSPVEVFAGASPKPPGPMLLLRFRLLIFLEGESDRSMMGRSPFRIFSLSDSVDMLTSVVARRLAIRVGIQTSCGGVLVRVSMHWYWMSR